MPKEITEPDKPDNIDMDKTIKVILRTKPSSANIIELLKEFKHILEKPQHRSMPSLKQPKKSKGYRDLIAKLGSGYPAKAV